VTTRARSLPLLLACALLAPRAAGGGGGVPFPAFSRAVDRPCDRPDRIRGVTLGIIEDNRLPVEGYGSPKSAWALEEIAALGAEWVSVTPYGTMISCDDAQVIPYFEFPRERMERQVVDTIAQAKERGLKVFLIPHVYPWDWCWRGYLRPGGGPSGTHEGWEAWFASYREFILAWARIAAAGGVDMMSIGVEFKSASSRFPDRFATLAGEVRAVFPGLLTYSANWDEVQDVPFWDHLDYIGLNSFYPMADGPTASPREMAARAAGIAGGLEFVARSYGKPVLFTEVGFKALRGALREPWIWPEHVVNGEVDEPLQALLFDITFSTFWGKDWFAGLFVWRYLSDPSDYSQEYPYGYATRLKPAEKVIETWFDCGI